MFQTHPETLEYFSQFSDLDTPDKQRTSEVFKDHAEKVCTTYEYKLQAKQ